MDQTHSPHPTSDATLNEFLFYFVERSAILDPRRQLLAAAISNIPGTR